MILSILIGILIGIIKDATLRVCIFVFKKYEVKDHIVFLINKLLDDRKRYKYYQDLSARKEFCRRWNTLSELRFFEIQPLLRLAESKPCWRDDPVYGLSEIDWWIVNKYNSFEEPRQVRIQEWRNKSSTSSWLMDDDD